MVGTLLGPDWSESVPLLRALTPAGLMVSLNVATGWVYLSLGRTDRQLRWRLVGSAGGDHRHGGEGYPGAPWGSRSD